MIRLKPPRKWLGKHHPALGPTRIRLRVAGFHLSRKTARFSRNGRQYRFLRRAARRCHRRPPLRSGPLNARPFSCLLRARVRGPHLRDSTRFGSATPISTSCFQGKPPDKAHLKAHKSRAGLVCRYDRPNRYRPRIWAKRFPSNLTASSVWAWAAAQPLVSVKRHRQERPRRRDQARTQPDPLQ